MDSKKARAIYKASEDKSRKAIIEKFVSIGIPDGTASTYFHRFKKEADAAAKTSAALKILLGNA